MMDKSEAGRTPEQRRDEKIVIEVGPDGRPFFKGANQGLPEDHIYFGIDKTPHGSFRTENSLDRDVGVKDRATAITQDARQLPVKENSVDKMVFHNVFGDSFDYHPPGVSRVGWQPRKPVAYFEKMLEEAGRVLKPGGQVEIGEFYTADEVPLGMEWAVRGWGNPENNQAYFKRFGLSVSEIITDPNKMRDYSRDAAEQYGFKFILILTKD